MGTIETGGHALPPYHHPLFATEPFIFHLTQTHHFSLFDNVTQLSSLGFVVLLPIALLFFVTIQKQ
jgi:hypothetical protein